VTGDASGYDSGTFCPSFPMLERNSPGETVHASLKFLGFALYLVSKRAAKFENRLVETTGGFILILLKL